MSLPISQSDRIELLDIFRGFAVFGIFVVNIEIMNCAISNQGIFAKQFQGDINLVVFRVLQLLFYSKFFPIFSFLFGLGISMQTMKLFKLSQNRISFYFRRMFFLFVIGVMHILFLWNGDVIHLYALLGLGIIYIIYLPDKWILGGSIFLLIFPFYDQFAFWFFEHIGFSPESFLEAYPSEKITELLRNGPYLETVNFRVQEYLSNVPILFVYLAPLALSMFLLEVYFGKNQFERQLDLLVKKTQKSVIWIMILTNAYRIIFIFYLPN